MSEAARSRWGGTVDRPTDEQLAWGGHTARESRKERPSVRTTLPNRDVTYR